MKLEVFNHYDFGSLRWLEVDGNPMFVAKDVTAALGFKNNRQALVDNCKGVRATDTLKNAGGYHEKIIPESDLFRLIMRSKLTSAEKFQDWVCEYVLPAIRKNSLFQVKPISMIELLEHTLVLEKDKESLKALNEASQRNIDHFQDVCNAMTAQFAAGTTAPDFCKQFNGVNSMQVSSSLVSQGVFIRMVRGYKVTSYYRDRYFKQEIFSLDNGKIRYQPVLTQDGVEWLYEQYLHNKLPMKKTWNGNFNHMIFGKPGVT
ncbi:MAG: prophage antirepressor-like protein [Psychromonas sp.]|jgi:prophage antirepressor-like protein|uniref:BRO-N domain-containing protein n=1 Tax=Psychromonas sp. TaxID=1884585 RepID=UPI0039E3CC66